MISSGLPVIWHSHSFPNRKWLKEYTKQKLKDIFLNQWYSSVENTRSLTNYRLIKKHFGIAHYLKNSTDKNINYLIKFRSRNHSLPIETGRWRNIPYENRKCPFCNTLGDEYHFLMECTHFSRHRQLYLPGKYYFRPNTQKYYNIMNTNYRNELEKLCKFLKVIMNTLSSM